MIHLSGANLTDEQMQILATCPSPNYRTSASKHQKGQLTRVTATGRCRNGQDDNTTRVGRGRGDDKAYQGYLCYCYERSSRE